MKMKVKVIIIMLVLCSMILSVAVPARNNGMRLSFQPPIEWMKTYGGSKIDYGNCVEQTNEGGYIFTGAYGRNAYTPWVGYVYLVKTDSSGNEVWHKTHGITNNENVGRTIQQTSDEGYIITGYTGYTYHIEGYVIKTDDSGNLVWSHTFGKFDYYDNLQCGWQTSDEGYIFTGWCGSYGAGGTDSWLIKTDADGNELWNKTFGGTDNDGGNYVQQTTDGGYIIVGSTVSYGTSGSNDLWIIKTDANGIEQWNHKFGGIGNDEGRSIQQIEDGYIITGYTTSYGAGNADVWVIKTDTQGMEEWNQTFGGNQDDIGNSVQQTIDGGYFTTGQYTNTTTQIPDIYIIKTDDQGNEEWDQIIDNNGKEDVGNYGIQTTDYGYIVVGNTGVYQQEVVDALLIKLGKTNSPPNEPNNPSPANNSNNVNLNADLSWSGGDPDGDSVTYDLYFGTSPTPPLLAEDISQTMYDPGTLLINTTYYWIIHSTDSFGASAEGPIWKFTTREKAPELNIESIAGKLGVSAVIQNNGSSDANNVKWNILITGGIFQRIHKNVTGTVSILKVVNETTITSGIFIGFGKISIAVSAICDEVPTPVKKIVSGTILLFWVKV